MFHIWEKRFQCKLCQRSFSLDSDLLLHNKAAAHINASLLSNNKVRTSTSTSFVDCGEANIKIEIIEEEETIDEDPLSIKMEAIIVEETIKHEIEEDIQDKDSDDDRINTIDIVHHKIEI